MLTVFNVAGMEDDVVAVEFDDMRVVVSCADGDGKFSSWAWFSWVRGGKFKNLVDSGGRATIVKGDEDADVIEECFFFLLRGERSVIWPHWTLIPLVRHEHDMSCFKSLIIKVSVCSGPYTVGCVFMLHTSSKANLPERLVESALWQGFCWIPNIRMNSLLYVLVEKICSIWICFWHQ